jgi:hypothetical protein
MKRLVKRKVFLMGMAVTAGLPVAAFAHGGGNLERDGYSHSRGGHSVPNSSPVDLIQEAPEMRIDGEGGGMHTTLLDKLKGMVESLSSRAAAVSAGDPGKEWKLELLQSEVPKLGSSDHPKANAAKPLGVSLNLKF